MARREIRSLVAYFIGAVYVLGLCIDFLPTSTDWVVRIYFAVLAVACVHLFKIRRLGIFGLYSVVFIVFNLYVAIPCANYALFGRPLFLPPAQRLFADPQFEYLRTYVVISTVSMIAYIIAGMPFPGRRAPTKGMALRPRAVFFLVIMSLTLLALELSFTGAANVIIANPGLGRQYLGKLPPLYEYPMLVGAYFLGKWSSEHRTHRRWIVLSAVGIAAYVCFWLVASFRGDALLPLLACGIGFYRTRGFQVTVKRILLFACLYVVFVGMSIYQRLGTKTFAGFERLVSFAPAFLNPGTLEYGTSYYNFVILSGHQFAVDYPLQSYFEQIRELIPGIGEGRQPSIFYRYRNAFFSDRLLKGGSSSGTGFSLQYESMMNFGRLLYWVPLFVLGLALGVLGMKERTTGGLYEIFMVLYLPYVLTVARSELPVVAIFTRLAYSMVMYYGLSVLIDRRSNRSSWAVVQPQRAVLQDDR